MQLTAARWSQSDASKPLRGVPSLTVCVFAEDCERLEGGDGGHRPGGGGPAEVRLGSVSHAGLRHAAAGQHPRESPEERVLL